MDITTVKLQKRTKVALDALRHDHESYDRIITNLLVMLKKKDLKRQLIEAYQSLGGEEQDILAEWEPASADVEE